MCRKHGQADISQTAAFYQNRIPGVGTWGNPFDRKESTALEADLAGQVLGMPGPMGTFGGGSSFRVKDVPGAKQMNGGSRLTGVTVGGVGRDLQHSVECPNMLY